MKVTHDHIMLSTLFVIVSLPLLDANLRNQIDDPLRRSTLESVDLNSNASYDYSSSDITSCKESYGKITFLSVEEQNLRSSLRIPLLLSHGGSGNTWLRILVERMTGHYTGSIRLDEQDVLKKILPGEGHCSHRAVAIKGHPPCFYFESSRDNPAGSPAAVIVPGYPDAIKNCKAGGIERFHRIVFLARDPYRSIWAEAQRHAPIEILGKDTQQRISDAAIESEEDEDEEREEEGEEDTSDRDDEDSTARVNRHIVSLSLKTSKQRKYWLAEAKVIARAYRDSWRELTYPLMSSLAGTGDFMVVRYEDLLDGKKRIRTLEEVARFLGFPPVAVSSSTVTMIAAADYRRRCSYLARKFSRRRRASKAAGMSNHNETAGVENSGSGIGRKDGKSRAECAFLLSGKLNAVIRRKAAADIRDAYALDKRLVCSMWRYLREFSSNFSYPVWQNRKCFIG